MSVQFGQVISQIQNSVYPLEMLFGLFIAGVGVGAQYLIDEYPSESYSSALVLSFLAGLVSFSPILANIFFDLPNLLEGYVNISDLLVSVVVNFHDYIWPVITAVLILTGYLKIIRALALDIPQYD
ncbi:hypothetical protein C436_20553 [Haloarcula marismortui ATCC 33800]|uniref:Uncharacterized protein n=1 Tax=Haloarcula marismortui ATCC 33800 TaxID=662476 RepID=M0JGB2_9EURY|nr:hypothetical protein C436_20553 [Haloarcula sinaiiensis ATCC 33800]